jgi:hypothetical protein
MDPSPPEKFRGMLPARGPYDARFTALDGTLDGTLDGKKCATRMRSP